MPKTLEDMKKEPKFYWTCGFCGFDKNVGTESTCSNCNGVRKKA